MTATDISVADAPEGQAEAKAKMDLVHFAGPNAHAYLAYWHRQRAGKPNGIAFGWVWGAFLAPTVWCFYRKLWLYGVLLLLVPMAIALLIPALAGKGSGGFAIAAGGLAKYLYVDQAGKAAAKADLLGLAGDARRDFLKRAGGVSWVGLGLGLALYGGFIVVAVAKLG